MHPYINTMRVLRKMPDNREQRRAEILQALRDPARLNETQLQELFTELAEIHKSLESDPPEVTQ